MYPQKEILIVYNGKNNSFSVEPDIFLKEVWLTAGKLIRKYMEAVKLILLSHENYKKQLKDKKNSTKL